MVYPEFKTKTKTSYFGKFTDWLSGNKSSIPDTESMYQKCLMTHLNMVQYDLTHFTANVTVDLVVSYTIEIVLSLVTQKFVIGEKPVIWRYGKLVPVSVIMGICSCFTMLCVYCVYKFTL